MKEFAEELMQQLQVETVFSIFGFDISESVVVTWIIMAIIVLLCIFMTRNLKVHNPSKRQVAVEAFVTWIESFIQGMIGENGKQYSDFLATILVYIAFANLIGLFGFKPPTKDLNVTLALSIISIVLIEGSGIRHKKFKNWLKSFAEPIAVVAPINILEVFIRPLSLCMRLFGNVLGAFVIMEMIKMVIPAAVPAAFSLYFDLFDGLIQAYVFVFLTSLYVAEATE